MNLLRSLLLLSAALFIGCNTCSQCHLTSSPSFNSRQTMTLLILPVTANGNPGLSQLPNFSDDISTPFLESGYRLIDRSAAKSEALKLGLDFDKGIDEKNIP